MEGQNWVASTEKVKGKKGTKFTHMKPNGEQVDGGVGHHDTITVRQGEPGVRVKPKQPAGGDHHEHPGKHEFPEALLDDVTVPQQEHPDDPDQGKDGQEHGEDHSFFSRHFLLFLGEIALAI